MKPTHIFNKKTYWLKNNSTKQKDLLLSLWPSWSYVEIEFPSKNVYINSKIIARELFTE